MEAPPRFITGAIIYDPDKGIYLIRRARPPEAGRWAFSSGVGASRTIDDPLKAVVEEVRSDLGCLFVPESLVTRLERTDLNPYPSFFYSGRIQGRIDINYKYCQQARWFSIDDAKKERLAFEHNQVLLQYLKK
jgi:ADP-ribose pyrophosphatase YjhB (NUDIX family)